MYHPRRGYEVLLAILLLLAASSPLGAQSTVQGITVLDEQQTLVAQDASQSDELGFSVAIHSRLIVAGAHRENGTRGAVYVFEQRNSRWNELAKLLPDGLSQDDFFGTSVAVSEDTIVGGAPRGIGRGAVYVFSGSGSTWVQVAKLTSSSQPANGDYFGFSVAVSGDSLLVGALGDDEACGGGPICDSGEAYIFVRTGGLWQEQQRLTASDAEEGAQFGWSGALQGDRAVVGAPGLYGGVSNGAVYVFERSGDVWTEQARLDASDGNGGDQFGISVALHGDTILVGAPADDDDQGSVYVFRRSGTGWSEQQKITLEGGAGFGFSVALYGETAVVGASQEAYLLSRTAGVFTRRANLRPVGWPISAFGRAVALDRDRAVVGSIGDDSACPGVMGCNSGAAFLFRIRELGSSYCNPAQPNSTGTFGKVHIFGSDIVAENALTLTASDLPESANIGYFIMGTGMATNTPPGSAGPICVAPGIKRYFPVESTDEYPGGFTRRIGTHGPISQNITPGSMWNFQAWHRDADAGTSNLTDAVAVSFR